MEFGAQDLNYSDAVNTSSVDRRRGHRALASTSEEFLFRLFAYRLSSG